MRRLVVALLFAASLTGAPGTMAAAEPLSGRYGYLVIDTEVARRVIAWRLNGNVVIDEVPEGVALRVGTTASVLVKTRSTDSGAKQ